MDLKYKVGDKVLMNKDSEYWGQQLDSIFGTIETIYSDFDDYKEDFHHYVVLWNSTGRIINRNFYREEDLLLYTDLKIDDYVITLNGLVGKIITIRQEYLALKLASQNIIETSIRNVIKIEI